MFQIEVMSQSSGSNSIYYTENKYNKLLEYYINSGKIKLNHPLVQPFNADELVVKMNGSKEKDFWSALLSEELNRFVYKAADSAEVNFNASVEGDLSFIHSDYFTKRYALTADANLIGKNIGMSLKLKTDERYKKDDPLFYGNKSVSVYGRAENAYLVYNTSPLKVFVGRFNSNYGFINEPSMILSSNAYSFDKVGFDLEYKFLKYTYFLTRLDDVFGGDVRADSLILRYNRRYLSMHRLDLNISDNFKFGLTEGVLFGGENQDLLFYYINPVAPFIETQQNNGGKEYHTDANLITALDFYFKPMKKVSVYTQWLIDDIDFKKSNRSKFPDRLGYTCKIFLTDYLIEGSQLAFQYNRINNWTYTSFFNFGNYTFYGKSLGYPFNSFEQYKISADYFGLKKIFFNVTAYYKRNGEQTLSNYFYALKSKFPMGIVQDIIGAEMRGDYFYSNDISAYLLVGYENCKNSGNVEGINKDQVFIDLNLSWRLTFGKY